MSPLRESIILTYNIRDCKFIVLSVLENLIWKSPRRPELLPPPHFEPPPGKGKGKGKGNPRNPHHFGTIEGGRF